MRVVITGASGYIGGYVRSQLGHAGVHVIALSRASEPGLFRCISHGTICGLKGHMKGVDHVIHLAGRLVDDAKAGVMDYFEANVAFTDQVLQAAVDSGVTSVVHASTRLLYPSGLKTPAVEGRDDCPDTAYGISKGWAEDLVRHYSTKYQFSALSLRIAQVTGGNHPGLGVINGFLRKAKANQALTVNGRGAAIREFVHVEDVARALIAATEYRGPWCSVNVGGTRAISVREIADTVAELWPGNAQVQTREVDAEDLSSYALSQERARRVLEWAPRWSPEQIIAAALAS